MRLYLGSSSSARYEILKQLFPNDTIILSPSNCSEAIDASGLTPQELVLQKTKLKTQACLKDLLGRTVGPDCFLICGDCVCVTKDGQICEKPANVQEANAWLDKFSLSKYIGVVQAIEVTQLESLKSAIDTDMAHCELKDPIPKIGREDYIDRAKGAAGCVIVEDPFIGEHVAFLSDLHGFMGLSPDLLRKLIEQVKD